MAAIGADLPARAISGVVMIALALAAAYLGGFVFVAFWTIGAIGVGWEWQRLIGGERVGARAGFCAVVLLLAAPWALHGQAGVALALLIVAALGLGVFADRGRRVAASAGVLYAGAAMLAPALLRGSPTQGLAAILWLFAVVWGADIGAYFGGRLIGGPKLWPAVSPGKTWSGAGVGAFVSTALATLVAALLTPGGVRVAPLLALGLVASALSQAGDLLESAMKRRAGVKDSSRLIPGHGGLMDRLDGFIVAAAFAAAVAWTRSQGPWIAPGLLKW